MVSRTRNVRISVVDTLPSDYANEVLYIARDTGKATIYVDDTAITLGEVSESALSSINADNLTVDDVTLSNASAADTKLETVLEALDAALGAQVAAGEITAGTETDIRRYSPADVKNFVDTHGGGGGGASMQDIQRVSTDFGEGCETRFGDGTGSGGTITSDALTGVILKTNTTSGGNAKIGWGEMRTDGFANGGGLTWMGKINDFGGGDGDATFGMGVFGVSAASAQAGAGGHFVGFTVEARSGVRTLYTVTCDASTVNKQSAGAFSSAQKFEASIYYDGTDIKFYFNGALTNTHTTNLPTFSSMGSRGPMAAGVSNRNTAGNIWLIGHAFSAWWNRA